MNGNFTQIQIDVTELPPPTVVGGFTPVSPNPVSPNPNPNQQPWLGEMELGETVGGGYVIDAVCLFVCPSSGLLQK